MTTCYRARLADEVNRLGVLADVEKYARLLPYRVRE
jgi:hypothetical protein